MINAQPQKEVHEVWVVTDLFSIFLRLELVRNLVDEYSTHEYADDLVFLSAGCCLQKPEDSATS